MEKTRHNYPQLTGARALAAYMVFLHHFTPTLLGNTAFSLLRELHIGVGIFFVLSGLLIYLRYSDSCVLKKEWLFSYYQNRVAKIYPAYFFIVLLNFIIFGGLLNFLLQITFIRGFSSEYMFVGVSQGWTLTVEFCFYALFPWLLLGIKRMGFLFPLMLIYLIGFIVLTAGSWLGFHGFFTPGRFVTQYTFFGNALEFFAGMYVAKMLLGQDADSVPKKNFRGLITYSSVCGMMACVYGFSRLANDQYLFGVLSPVGGAIAHLLLPLFIAAFFYGLITEKSLVRSILQSKLAVLLGESSYIFYLIHLGVFFNLLDAHVSNNRIIIFILLNLIAIFFYYTIEKPCHKFIKNLGRNKINENALLVAQL